MTQEIRPIGFVQDLLKEAVQIGLSRMILLRTKLISNKGLENIEVVPASDASVFLYVIWAGSNDQPVVKAGGITPLHQTFNTS